MGWVNDVLGSAHEGSTGGVLADGTVPAEKIGDRVFERGFDCAGFWYGTRATAPAVDPAWIRPECECGWKGADIRWDRARGEAIDQDAFEQWMQHVKPLTDRQEADDAARAVRELLVEKIESLPLESRLVTLRQLGQAVTYWTEASVKANREAGRSWTDIGAGLGLSKGSAHSRYRRLTGEAEDPAELEYGHLFTQGSEAVQ
jgi:hypothetical protein